MRPDQSVQTFAGVELAALPAVAAALVKEFNTYRVWLFHGEMGAGKTTLIKELCRTLGVHDTMSSPTFSIVNEYETHTGDKIFHFDFYRIRSEAEAYDIGTEEYFYSGHYCFVEWPEKIPGLLPDAYAEIFISTDQPTSRTIELSLHG